MSVQRTSLEECPHAELLQQFARVRRATEALAEPLSAEDCVAQSMTEASPVHWQLAHTSWFFETFVLEPHLPGYELFDPQFGYLFNSYYNAVGDRVARNQRGLMTRPGVDQVLRYRAHVEVSVERFLTQYPEQAAELEHVISLGCHHEQQHQELILTDLKHLLSLNALPTVYCAAPERTREGRVPPMRFVPFRERLDYFGAEGPQFSFDNETPRHRVFVESFELAARTVTNGEYMEFMRDGGYSSPELWLSDGWDTVGAERWHAPLYWTERDGEWYQFTLSGERLVDPSEPVTHVSYFEADAYATWADARLPSEYEWELAARDAQVEGNFVEEGEFHPRPVDADAADGLTGLFGDVWEWTRSPYAAYPRFRPARGALGEYNGKFMCNQFVLRGGSCASPREHLRASYRNFFYPGARWQFSGIRLARDV